MGEYGSEPGGDAAAVGTAGRTRRDLMKAALAAGVVAGAGGVAGGMTGAAAAVQSAQRTALRKPGSLPYPHLAAGTDTIPQIKHIVVLMLENHSYDNHLGMLRRPGADGFTLGSNGKPTAQNPYPDGRIQHAFRMPTTCQLFGHPSQNWVDSHTQLNGGKLNGFVKSASGPVAMGYWEKADLPFYYSLASTFPLADRYFSSVVGPTFPNRRYLMAGTSLGMVNDGVPNPFDYPANGTIFDRLHKIGVPWADYFSLLGDVLPVPTAGLFPELLIKYADNIMKIEHFFAHAKAARCRASASSSRTTSRTPRKTRRTSRTESSSPPASSTPS